MLFQRVTVKDIDLEALAAQAQEADDSGTKRGEPAVNKQVNGEASGGAVAPPIDHEGEKDISFWNYKLQNFSIAILS